MTDAPEPKQPVAIGGEVVGELLARIENSDDAVAALRQRLADVNLAYAAAEDLASMAEGSLGKLIAPAGVRGLTVSALLRLGEVLGLRLLIVADEKLTRKMQPSWQTRDRSRAHSRRPPKIGRVQLKRFLPEVAAELGRRGGLAWVKRTTPEERSRMGKLGAQIRWSRRADASRQASRAAARPE
jgi:hypothetical protein